MKRLVLVIAVLFGMAIFCVAADPASPPPASQSQQSLAPPAAYVVLVWSELGMHCIDGKDYSVFAVLPPFNVIHAQVVKRGEPPQVITTGITLTYEAIADASGSINTYSAPGKTNFWDWVRTLFLNSIPPNVGLAGYSVQSRTPQNMTYNASLGYWEAVGIPTVPYDDAGKQKPYPLAKVVARMGSQVLASSTVVLAVSDEMNCITCHRSNTDPYAKPNAGWENNPDPLKDVKLNILKKHDDRFNITQFLPTLATKGYNYDVTLYKTATGGTAVLCDACHASNALPGTGIPGVNPLTQDMHTLHGPQIYLKTGQTLDSATTPFNSCYLCHPGLTTRCQRGAMVKTACMNCHGNLTKVGSPTRVGWMTLPACQMCHNSGLRYPSAFDSNGQWRQTTDTHFATEPNVPSQGFSLYRFSNTGHGNLYCSGCHGSQHAEYATLQANDNRYSISLQGHTGKLTECIVCHTNVPVTATLGPHKMHTIGQGWVNSHPNYVDQNGFTACAYCHGPNYLGTALSATSMARTFTVEDNGQKSYLPKQQVSCYDCHNGPSGG